MHELMRGMAAGTNLRSRFSSRIGRRQAPRAAGVLVALVASLLLPAAAQAYDDLALKKPASASSTEDGWGAGVGPAFANDGETDTRWSSDYADHQWWRVDLGSARTVTRVWINWTNSYASSYRIEVSTDGTNYDTVWQGAASGDGWKVHSFSSAEARYVRFVGVDRATQYGFSFWDFQVYDLTGATSGPGPAPTPPTVPATCQPNTAWRAAGSLPLSDAAAAACVRPTAEDRPANSAANHHVVSASELSTFRSQMSSNNPLLRYVTGGFTGTTDEIVQWAARKWGIPEDVVSAEFVQESWWDQTAMGDRHDGVDASRYPPQARIDSDSVYETMGISQLKWRPGGSLNPGIEPLRWKSTAFAADYYGSAIKYYYDGLCNFCGAGYSGGQGWASIGAYYAPTPWWGANAQYYVSRVQVRLNDRTWEKPGF